MSTKKDSHPSSQAFDTVVQLTRQYFGSDSPKHVARFLHAHLDKTPDQITSEDIISLINWLRVLASFLEDDEERIEQYIADLYKHFAPDVFRDTEDD